MARNKTTLEAQSASRKARKGIAANPGREGTALDVAAFLGRKDRRPVPAPKLFEYAQCRRGAAITLHLPPALEEGAA